MQIKLPMRSRKWQHKYLQDPATICSPIDRRLQNITPRLASSLGVSAPSLNVPVLNFCIAVKAIIRAIRKRQVVHRLDLGTSSLGDAGCARLFEFLTSPAGLGCRDSLTELFLTKNEISAQGLLAVATFLKGNMILRQLCLSGVSPHFLASFPVQSCTCTLEPSDH